MNHPAQESEAVPEIQAARRELRKQSMRAAGRLVALYAQGCRSVDVSLIPSNAAPPGHGCWIAGFHIKGSAGDTGIVAAAGFIGSLDPGPAGYESEWDLYDTTLNQFDVEYWTQLRKGWVTTEDTLAIGGDFTKPAQAALALLRKHDHFWSWAGVLLEKDWCLLRDDTWKAWKAIENGESPVSQLPYWGWATARRKMPDFMADGEDLMECGREENDESPPSPQSAEPPVWREGDGEDWKNP